jgi:membrane-associated protease RseP (regulator of RpoE activity)
MPYTFDELTEFVKAIFNITDITMGTTESKFVIRYRGLLIGDSLESFNLLSEKIKPFKLTPLFREEEGKQAIILVASRPDPKPSNPAINLVLFILTLLSVFFTGIMYVTGNVFPNNWPDLWKALLAGGLPFGLSMVAIFGTHEFGHYIAGRLRGVKVTLPYFIPLPFSPLGTMGAFINIKEQPRNRRDLLDIGIAGPLSGFIVSLIVLFIGLKLSHLGQIETQLPAWRLKWKETRSFTCS